MKTCTRRGFAFFLSAVLLVAGLLPVPALALPKTLEDLKTLQGLGTDSSQVAVPDVQGQAVPDTGASGKGCNIPPELQGVLTSQELGSIFGNSCFITQNYVGSVKPRQLYYGAMRGMFQTLDKYSQFFDPDEYKKFQEHLGGSFAGIGVVMGKKEEGGPLPAQFVTPNSPAEKAGMLSGDDIVEINGVDVGPMSTDEVIENIRGPEHTQVTIQVQRRDDKTKQNSMVTLTITREQIRQNNSYSKMLPGNKGYIYFDVFFWNSSWDNSATEVLGHVRRLRNAGASMIVLDVRNNGGGDLRAVKAISSVFLKKGQTILIMKDRQGREDRTTVSANGDFSNVPLKLLVNEYSASASEILAGALKDNKRATIIGRKTYGKGCAQSLIPFQDGSAVKLTTEHWYTPSGASIDNDGKAGQGGVAPDVTVDVTDEVEMKAMGRIMRELSGAPGGDVAPDPALEAAVK